MLLPFVELFVIVLGGSNVRVRIFIALLWQAFLRELPQVEREPNAISITTGTRM